MSANLIINSNTNHSMSQIPIEIYREHILSNITELKDIAACERVCKFFLQFSSDEKVWGGRLKKLFSDAEIHDPYTMSYEVQYKTAMQFDLQIIKMRKRVDDLRGSTGFNGLINAQYENLKKQGRTDDKISKMPEFKILTEELVSLVGDHYDGSEKSISPDSKLGKHLECEKNGFLSMIKSNRQNANVLFFHIYASYQKCKDYIKDEVSLLRGSNGFNGKINDAYEKSKQTGNSYELDKLKSQLKQFVGENFNGNKDSISKDSLLAKISFQRQELDVIYRSCDHKFNPNLESSFYPFLKHINELRSRLPSDLFMNAPFIPDANTMEQEEGSEYYLRLLNQFEMEDVKNKTTNAFVWDAIGIRAASGDEVSDFIFSRKY